MKKGIKKKYPKLFEFRIKYNAGDYELDSYHYYSAVSAEEASRFHITIANKRGYSTKIISIEQKNPYLDCWEDCGETPKENEHK